MLSIKTPTTFIASILATTALAAPLLAQDRIDVGPTRITAPMAEPTVFAFDGFYAGVMADYSTYDDVMFATAKDDDGNPVVFGDGSSLLGYGLVIGVSMADYRYNDIRRIQRPTWVYGVELGLNGGTSEETSECRDDIDCTTKVTNGLVSVAGRFGVIMPQASNLLIYGKAGWSSKTVALDAEIDTGEDLVDLGGTEETLNGLSIGAGVEFAITNAITARLEGNYTNYSDFESQLSAGPVLNGDFDSFGIAAGLSYNF